MRIIFDLFCFIIGIGIGNEGFKAIDKSANENKVMPFVVGILYVLLSIMVCWNFSKYIINFIN